MTKARANFIIKDAESNQEKIEKTEKIKTNDFGFVSGKSYLNNDRSQNYLIFQLIFKTFTMPTGDTNTNIVWNSKGLSGGSINPLTTDNNSLAPKLNRKKWIHNSKIAVEFEGSFLNQDKATFTHSNVVNMFIIYESGT